MPEPERLNSVLAKIVMLLDRQECTINYTSLADYDIPEYCEVELVVVVKAHRESEERLIKIMRLPIYIYKAYCRKSRVLLAWLCRCPF
jgi:hypothetical protein